MVTLSHLIEKSAFRRVLLSTGLLLCLCSVLNIAAAQSTSQVTIVGIPPVLPSPYADDIETSFVTGQYQIIFNYTSFSNTPAEFAFRFEVLKDNRPIVEIESMPEPFTPGTYVFTSFFEDLFFPQGANDLFQQLEGDLQNQIVQTGTLPEANYTIRVTARPVSRTDIVQITGNAHFAVRYPSPPILVSPSNGSEITMDIPIFAWTPVVNTMGLQMEYEFLLVEILPGQTPYQAISSNRSLAREIVIGTTTLPYTFEFLPLMENAEYAWQITAKDAAGDVPLQNDGKTEIYTFHFKPEDLGTGALLTGVSDLEEIPLIPQFAILKNLEGLSVSETPSFYQLSGSATLELQTDVYGVVHLPVTVTGLDLQKASLDNPVITGGAVTGNAGQLSDLFVSENPWIEFDELFWEFGKNVGISASVIVPGDSAVEASGELILTRNGPEGILELSGNPLAVYNDAMLDVTLTSLSVAFPGNQTNATGSVELAGIDSPCAFHDFTMFDSQVQIQLLCNDPTRLPLVETSDFVMMDLERVRGSITIDTAGGLTGYDLEIRSFMGLKTTEGSYCGNRARLTADSEEGLVLSGSQQDCPVYNPRMDLGFASIQLEEVQLQEVSYDPAAGEWDFQWMMDATLEVEAFGSWSSLMINDIEVSREGITFNEIQFHEDSYLHPLPEFDAGLFRVILEEFGIGGFTFPIFDWDETGAGPWELTFGGEVSVRPVPGTPICLLGTSLRLYNGRVDQGQLVSDLMLDNFEGCEWELAPGTTIRLDSIAGRVGAEYPPFEPVRPFGELFMGGSFVPGTPFSCGEEYAISFTGEELVYSDGIVGTLHDVIPPCPLQVGPFEAQMTSSAIHFAVNETGEQQAVMDGEAVITLDNGVDVNGYVEVDLVTGEFISAAFIMDQPFDWHIPSAEEPILTFRLEYAEISENGFFVDGRHTLLLPGSDTGVTFDEMVFDLEEFRVKEGRIIFDESFALETGLEAGTEQLLFRARPSGGSLTLDPGLLMELSGTVVIDSNGLHMTGAAEVETKGSVAFSGKRYDSDVTVEFTEDFSLSLFPFGIFSGRADLFYRNERFAYADPSGFHPVPAFFADLLIPERLPLPSEEIAYLQLRDGDDLLVHIDEDEEGNYILSTLPGEPLSLVLPFLDPAAPPEITSIELNDLTITPDPFSPEVVSGSVTASAGADHPLFNLQDKNIPLTVRTIEFGTRVTDGSPLPALYFLGDLHLFDQELNSDEEVEFYISEDGYIRASLDVTGVNSELAMIPGEQVVIGVDALQGDFEMQIGSGNPLYDFSVSGSLRILTDQGYHAGAELTLRTQSGGYLSVSHFEPYLFDESAGIGFGNIYLRLEEIVSMPRFAYTALNGFDFAIDLNVSLDIELAGNQEMTITLEEIEIGNEGLYIPPQDINESSIPGLKMPEVELGGFLFRLLAFRMDEGFNWNWEEESFEPGFTMDVATELPGFEGSGLNPPDGLLFTNVGYQDGYLTGSMEPYSILGNAEVAVGPEENAPTLMIEEITGALSGELQDGERRQTADFRIKGKTERLPAFTPEDPALCEEGAAFDLAIVEGRAFEGTITNVKPCGTINLGPIEIEVTNGDLYLFLDEHEQIAELESAVEIYLPAGDLQQPVRIEGELVIDMISGEIRDGQVEINQPFHLPMPSSDHPFFTLQVEQALLDRNGITVTGSGSLQTEEVHADITYDHLLIGLPSFEIVDGRATIEADFAVQFTPGPFSFELVAPDSPHPDGDVLRMDLHASAVLDSYGIGFTGTSHAHFQINNTNYSDLRVELVDDFTISITGLAITRGRAEFYWDEGGVPASEPIAIVDEYGFHLGSGLIALLPDRLPLPTEDIAWIELRDDEGNLNVEVETTDAGYTLSSNGQFVPIVLASVVTDGEPFTVGVQFTLQTDGYYNVIAGEIELETSYPLEPVLNLPVTLTKLALTASDELRLEAGLSADLPSIFSGYDADTNATMFVTLGTTGFESGIFTIGQVDNTYNPNADPLFTYQASGSFDGITDTFTASLMGMEVTVGPTNTIRFTTAFQSSLVMGEEEQPLWLTASWNSGEWNFHLDMGAYTNEFRLGQAIFQLDGQDPVTVTAGEDHFYISFSGQVSFEEILEEPVVISIRDLQVGVRDYRTSPALHFFLGEATGMLGDQELSLFDNAVVFTLTNPSIILAGRELALSSDGHLHFLGAQIDYQGLQVTTAGQIELDEIAAADVQIVDGYLVLESFALHMTDGLRVESELALTLPAPVQDYSATGSLHLYRDVDGSIVTEETGLRFDLEERYGLLNFGEFELTKVHVEVNPFEWTESEIYANGNIYIESEPDPVIEFGQAANFPGNAGIRIGYSDNEADVLYNITGNPGFDVDINFFTISVTAGLSATSGEGFEILLAGSAGINLDGVEADLDYGGIRITEEGLIEYGNITGGSIDVAGIASLTVGQFYYHRDDVGFALELADTESRNPEDLRDAGEVEMNTVQAVELLCFGPCPEAGPEGASYSGPALTLTIHADAGNDTGGISGGVDRIMLYRTASGLSSLSIENAHIQIDNIFEMYAGLNYVEENSGMLLRAAATGSFNIGGSSVAATVAGKFSAIGNDVSFGLFVAVQPGAGIPIVPGVITLTGAGGGFFYKPVQEDLDLVHHAMASIGHELVNPDGASIQGTADFAVMLYASVGIAGAAEVQIIEGTTLFQITSQSFYMDARAFVLGMDGVNSVANTKVTGEISASIQRNPFAMLVSIDVDVEVPLVLEGGGGIQFFMNKTESNLAWGIVGHTHVDLFGGLLTGGAEFLAGNPGFMLQVDVGLHLDIAIIKVESNVSGAIWAITDPGYQFPFGAYVTFDAQATVLLVTISAKAQAAFVTRNPSGFELFASVAGCVRILGADECVAAWASIANDGVAFGFGTGAHAGLVSQASAQLDDFRAHILSLMSQIPGALAALGLPEPLNISTPEEAMEAGYHYYSLPLASRIAWDALVNDSNTLASLPQALQNLNSQVMRSPNPSVEWPNRTSFEQAAQSALDILAEMDGEITADMITAYELQASAEEELQQMLSSMSESPVKSVIKPTPTLTTSQSVDFTIDDELAAEQIQRTEQYKMEAEQMNARYRESIDQVLNSLDEMSGLLQTDVPHERAGHLINMAHWYGEIYEEMEKYFALNANKVWNEIFWSANGLQYLSQNSPAILNAIQQLSTEQEDLITAYLSNANYSINPSSVPQALRNTLNSAALRLAQRENFILRFAQGNVNHPGWGGLPSPNSNQAPAEVQRIYNVFSYPITTTGVNSVIPQMGVIQEINHNYWYNMHVGGLEAYRQSRLPLVGDVIFNRHHDYKNQVFGPMENITQILDEFYTIKANITSIAYNMIDGYLAWRQDHDFATGRGSRSPGLPVPGRGPNSGSGGDTTVVMYGNQRFSSYEDVNSYLAQQLQPPQITNITVYPNRPPTANGETYYNETEIEWTALHPDEIIESSISVLYTGEEDTDIQVGSDTYLSVGNRNHFTLYPYSYIGTVRNVNFGVRVRGSAGNTAIRRAFFTVDVHPSGSSSVPPGGSVIPQATQPPMPPVIDLASHYTPSKRRDGDVYWTNQPESIRLTFTAHDPAVGIGQWEYSVGSSPGSADVLGWTILQGQTSFHPEIPAHKVTGMTGMLTLEPGQEYYISARVRNTLGQLSEVTILEDPIMVDLVAPSGITFMHQPSVPGAPHQHVEEVYPSLPTVPPFRATPRDYIRWTQPPVAPSLLFDRIRATDEHSGFSHIEYVVSDLQEPPVGQFAAGNYLVEQSRTLHYTDDNLEYNKEYYWHVRTVDRAGNIGEIETYGPYLIADTTIPHAGRLQAVADMREIKLYMIEPPHDPESDLAGIQIAVGRSSDQADIRAFPQGPAIDFRWTAEETKELFESGGTSPKRYLSIPLDELGGAREPVYIFYRSVNTRGMFSNISATGPLQPADGTRKR